MTLQAQKDSSTVTPDGIRKLNLIEGVQIRPAVTHVDDRGTVTEIYSPAWGVHESPLVFTYQLTIRPGKVKGWALHHTKDDRLFLSQGNVKFVLYDDRPGSPTYKRINEFYVSEYHRSLIVIPAFVWHALQNVGSSDALLVSMPTQPYNHSDPDVYRLPPNNDLIPYRFEDGLGY
jgi:dTDP-4-dehydrorhamnose 3,5-epimerase